MSATTAQIRTALNTKLAAGFGAAWNTSAYYLAKPEPPQLDIMTGPLEYDLAMARGLDLVTLVVRACVQWGDAVSAQEMLDPLLDPESSSTSMKAIVEADKTLGGVVDSLRVTKATEPKVYAVSGASDVIGVEFTVEVYP